MHEKGSKGLLVRVEPLQRAKELCEMMVEGERDVDGALPLDL